MVNRQKNEIPYERLSLPKLILFSLLGIVGGLASTFESPYRHIKRLHREVLGIPDFSKWQYNKAVRRLRDSGYLTITKRGEQQFMKLTKKGKISIFLKTLGKVSTRPKVWDKKWRIIIWDIPETSRKQRDRIRWFAKTMGFHQLQKSVFIIPYQLGQAAVNYLKESGLLEFIRILRIDRIDHDKDLKKHFDLK